MGLFSRFTDIINANINAMLDKAEDAEKMLALIINEMEETLVEVRASAAKNIAEKKTIERHIKDIEQRMVHWQQQAELALKKNRDDLAKSALREKQHYSHKLTELSNALTIFEDQLAKMQQDGQQLQTKLAEAKAKQKSLAQRQQSAEVRLKVKQQAVVHNIDDAISKFERYQQKVDRIEAEVEAFDIAKSTSLAQQFTELENDDKISQELAALKKKVVNQ